MCKKNKNKDNCKPSELDHGELDGEKQWDSRNNTETS